MSKMMKTPKAKVSRGRKGGRGRASVIATTAIVAGVALAPTASEAALNTGTDQAAYSTTITEGTTAALRDFLRLHPSSELAKPVFVQLAALCGGGKEARDPDCTGSLAAGSTSDPPEPPAGEGGRATIY
jgi:hypothetical protein